MLASKFFDGLGGKSTMTLEGSWLVSLVPFTAHGAPPECVLNLDQMDKSSQSHGDFV